MAATTIEWTEATWNPVTGCSKMSPGCLHCYAERMARRLQAMGQPNYVRGFEVAVHEDTLQLPLSWKKPQMVFVNSMSDLFHDTVPAEFIRSVFDVMVSANWLQFQVLTKRSQRLVDLASEVKWPDNVWMGVSVENEDFAFRVDHLRQTPAAVKFVSIEPMLGPIRGLDLAGIDWVIVGGESGPGARPNGSGISGTSAWRLGCRSSSSSGEASTRNGQEGFLTTALGIRCPVVSTLRADYNSSVTDRPADIAGNERLGPNLDWGASWQTKPLYRCGSTRR
jgi:protein gp37